MSVSREDILRELELLPVWKLNQAVSAKPDVAQIPLDKSVLESATFAQSSLVKPTVALAQETQAKPQGIKIKKEWLLCYLTPTAEAEACRSLMHNIAKAMQLTEAQYALIESLETLTGYEAGNIMLFGAHTVQGCGLEHDINQLRGQAHLVNQTQHWVTYHPAEMLSNPVLKKAVWQDICAAMQAAQLAQTQ